MTAAVPTVAAVVPTVAEANADAHAKKRDEIVFYDGKRRQTGRVMAG